ncbi:MAG: TolC family protein [Acidobacteria bacterium]|nr:TolC family protein [Acidobacteriota bacterium]
MKRLRLVLAWMMAAPLAITASAWAAEPDPIPLSLAAAVGRSLANHPMLAAGQAGVRAAQQGEREARAGRWARVDFSESFNRSNNPVFVFSSLLTQRQFAASNFSLGALNRPDFVNNFQSLVVAEQPLYDGGRARAAMAQAAGGRAEAEADEQSLRLALARRTAEAYLNAVLAREGVRVAAAALESAQASLKTAESIRDAGRSTELDVLAVKVHRAAMAEQLIRRQSEQRQAEAALNEAMGAPLSLRVTLTTDLAPPSSAAPPTTVERPEQRIADAQLRQAEALRQAAHAAMLPQVVARGVFEADRQRFVTDGGANWLAGVTLKWTPFQAGADRARVRAAVERINGVKANRKALDSRIALELEQSQEAVISAQARASATEEAVAMAAESLRITKNRYEAGLATVTELLRAETASAESGLRLLAARHNLRLSEVAREAARGTLTADSAVLR